MLEEDFGDFLKQVYFNTHVKYLLKDIQNVGISVSST